MCHLRRKIGICIALVAVIIGAWAMSVLAEEVDVNVDSGTEEPYRMDIILSTNPATDIPYGTEVTLTATFAQLLETYPTGSVTFGVHENSDLGIEVEEVVTLTADMEGVATYVFTPPSVGEYVLYAYYAPDDSSAYGDNESDTYTFTVVEEVVKLTQTIEVVDVGEKTYGDEPFTLSITGQTGTGAVSYVVTEGDAITIEGDVATIVGIGEVVVEATVAEDETYYEAKATLMFSVESLGRVEAPVASRSTAMILASGEEITLSTATEGAVIYYVTNTSGLTIDEGLILTDGSVYNGALSMPNTSFFYIYAVATKEGMDNSSVSEHVYRLLDKSGWGTTSGSNNGINTYQPTTTSEETVTFEGNFTSSESGAISLLDDTSGVAVFGETGVIPTGALLSVEEVSNLSEYNSLVQAQLGEGFELISAFDINLLQDGQAIQPNGTVQLGLPIPEGYDLTNGQVVYIGDDGKITEYGGILRYLSDDGQFIEDESDSSSGLGTEEGKLTFETPHFSIYGIIVPVEEEVVEAVIEETLEEKIEETVEEEVIEESVEVVSVEVETSWMLKGIIMSGILCVIVIAGVGIYYVKRKK